MEKKDMIWLASKAFSKGWDFETLKYSDDMNGKESLTEDVYEYVEEIKEEGMRAFREKYKEYKLY